ncbi:MAG: hypothetical protein LBU16_03370 [Treponema sp.]|nr:hypothetical protein [Treponema sp.]
MIIFRKAAFSLLISILLFAVFTVLAFTGLFDLVEARFYNPAVARAIAREIDADAQVIEEFLEELWIRFATTLEEGAVRRSFLSNLESEDIALRASLYGELLESLGGLQSVRFIDSGGRRIHFSTWAPDVLRQDRDSVAYRNYDARENNADYIPYGQVEATAPRLILDGEGERIIFSYPLYDSFDVYRGTALFSLSVRAVMDRMVSAGRIKVGEDVSVVAEPPGLVTGLPPVGRDVLLPLIARVWSENSFSLDTLDSGSTEVNLALISRKMGHNIYIGRLVNESLLSFPLAMRIILLASFLTTVFLIIFLIFNFRQDNTTIIQSRLKKLQVNLLEEYYEHTGDLNWSRWRKELEHRRDDIYSELKRGLSARAGDLAEIDGFIDRSWDDLMAIIGGRMERLSGIEGDTLRALLGRLLPETAAASKTEAREPEKIEVLDEADIVEALEGPAGERSAEDAPELELEELEVAEQEIIELEHEEPEVIESLDEAEELEDPAGDEAVPDKREPELAELEAAELVEPLTEESEARMGFYEIDPSEEDSGKSGVAINTVVSAIEFSPESEKAEQEKEEAARSMAENFEIQSPFASIFSALSEEELKPEPVEDLESLEREGPPPDDSPETEAEAEELRLRFADPLLSIPFVEALNGEITVLAVEDEDEDAPTAPEYLETEQAPEETVSGGVVMERDGVIYINENILSPDKETLKGLDRNVKNLIDSILNNT